jgi:hypothetical protein
MVVLSRCHCKSLPLFAVRLLLQPSENYNFRVIEYSSTTKRSYHARFIDTLHFSVDVILKQLLAFCFRERLKKLIQYPSSFSLLVTPEDSLPSAAIYCHQHYCSTTVPVLLTGKGEGGFALLLIICFFAIIRFCYYLNHIYPTIAFH